MSATRVDARAVACPDCGAGRSEMCLNGNGTHRAPDHEARVALAERVAAHSADAILVAFEELWPEAFPLPPNWKTIIRRYEAAGLGPEDIRQAVLDTLAVLGVKPRDLWRTFTATCFEMTGPADDEQEDETTEEGER